MISRSNYEIYFIDYIDGKLDRNRQEELFAFLKANADLQDEFDRFSGNNIEPDLSIGFSGRERLKRDTITVFNYKTWFVGYVENDLSADQRKETELFLSQNPALKAELEILKRSKLVPDRTIIFDKKKSLRRDGKVISFTPAVKRVIRIAAVILIFLLTYFLIQELNSPQSMVAEHDKKPELKINTPESNPQSKYDTLTIQKEIKSPAEENLKSAFDENKLVVDNKQNLLQEKEKVSNPSKGELTKIDSTPEKQFTPNQTPVETAMKNDSDNVNIEGENNGGLIPQINPFVITAYTPNKLSDIFSDEDLKEFATAKENNKAKEKTAGEIILNRAAIEIKRISKTMNVSLEKEKNSVDNTTTYAFVLGNKFSVSHTVSEDK